MALVSGIIVYNAANQYATFKRDAVSTFNLNLPKKLSYEIGIDQSTSCTGIYIQDSNNQINILLEVEFANPSKKQYFQELFGLISRIIRDRTVTLLVCEKPIPKNKKAYTYRVLTELFGKLEWFLETNPDLAQTRLESIYPQAWKSRIIDKSKGPGRINSKQCTAEDLCDMKPLLTNYLIMSPAKDLDGFDACGILLGYKRCAFTETGQPKIYGEIEKRHKTMVYYRYLDVSEISTKEDFTKCLLKPLGEAVNYLRPELKVYNKDYNLLKNIKMASSKYCFTITQLPNKEIEPLRWEFGFEYDDNKVMFAYIVKEADFRKGDISILNDIFPWHLEYGSIS